jgi:hypothetical protein
VAAGVRSRLSVLLAVAFAVAGCSLADRVKGPAETPAPTPLNDFTTYEEIERALTGRWRMTTPWDQAGDFYPTRELIFGPNRVWVTPTFRDYGGRYTLESADVIRVRHDPTDTERVWQFQLDGDSLTLSANGVTVQYARVVALTSTPRSE